MLDRFVKSESGNFAIYFALAIIPVFGTVGLAIDYTGRQRLESELQQAADAAVIAASAETDVSLSDRQKVANDYFDANFNGSGQSLKFVLTEEDEGYVYKVNANYQTSIAGVIGFKTLPVQVIASTAVSSDPIEIALVLDNTGSMAPYIDTLKSTTVSFAQSVFEASSNGNVKMAVVPFNGAVNPGPLPSRYVDEAGDAKYNGIWFEKRNSMSEEDCVNLKGVDDPGKSGEEGAWLSIPGAVIEPVLGAIDEIFGVKLAFAWTKGVPIKNRGDIPPGYTMDGCWAQTPAKVSHTELYKLMGAKWAGCVEARAEPYDTDDTVPGNSANTRFVPYLWPSEPSKFPKTHNIYLQEQPDWDMTGWDRWNHSDYFDVVKYMNSNKTNIVETGSKQTGPNKGCPAPLMPLTDDGAKVEAKLQAMSFYAGSGTVASEGIMWGWRALSPGEPLNQGSSYGKSRKILVLFGDGKNELNDNLTGFIAGTDYGAYGYGKGYRFGSGYNAKLARVTPTLNDKMELACVNAKKAGVEIYTVLFNEADATTKKLYSECATSGVHSYEAVNTEALKAAFADIANSINKLRLTR
jgi:Flp pilus assembly protein TadG